jgi:hypothetical protein
VPKGHKHSYPSNVPQIAPGLDVNLSLPRKLDEEVVNMGLVLLLNALAIKTPNITTTCSSERAALSARFMQDGYEAKTDGVLLFRDRTVQAILEVKPRCRDKLRPHVRMQESRLDGSVNTGGFLSRSLIENVPASQVRS